MLVFGSFFSFHFFPLLAELKVQQRKDLTKKLNMKYESFSLLSRYRTLFELEADVFDARCARYESYDQGDFAC